MGILIGNTASLSYRRALILGEDEFNSRRFRKRLKENGVLNVDITSSKHSAVTYLKHYSTEFLIILTSKEDVRDQYVDAGFVRMIRALGYLGFVIVISPKPSMDELFSFLKAGINDYLISGRYCDIVKVIMTIFESGHLLYPNPWHPDIIENMGLFPSLGLSKSQVTFLSEYAKDFSKFKDLSKRTGKSEGHIRVDFNNINQKLSATLGIHNRLELIKLLTICDTIGGRQIG